MEIVKVKILETEYPISCADGQKEHLLMLNKRISERLKEYETLKGGNTLRLVILLLRLEDEILNQSNKLNVANAQIETLNKAMASDDRDEAEAELSQVIIEYARKIEKIADKLNS